MRERVHLRGNGEISSRERADFCDLLGLLKGSLLARRPFFLLFILERDRQSETKRKRETKKEAERNVSIRRDKGNPSLHS